MNIVVSSGKKTVFLVLILLQAGAFCFEWSGGKKPAAFESLTFSAAASTPTIVSPEQRYSRTITVSATLFKTASVWESLECSGCSETVFRERIFSGFPQTLQTLGCQLTI